MLCSVRAPPSCIWFSIDRQLPSRVALIIPELSFNPSSPNDLPDGVKDFKDFSTHLNAFCIVLYGLVVFH